MGSGFGIMYSSAFMDAETNHRYVGLVFGLVLYTFGVIKLRDVKNKNNRTYKMYGIPMLSKHLIVKIECFPAISVVSCDVTFLYSRQGHP